MGPDLEARVSALEVALAGIVGALAAHGMEKPVIDHLAFVATETARGKREAPAVSRAAAALLKTLSGG